MLHERMAKVKKIKGNSADKLRMPKSAAYSAAE